MSVDYNNLLNNFKTIGGAVAGKQEYECRFYLWQPKDETALKKKLTSLKGKKVHAKKQMSRYIFALANGKPGFVRVRKEHNKITLTTKRYDCVGCNQFPSETEVTVSDFDTAYNILKAAGLQQKSYQETKRETWSLPIKGVKEIVFDNIPGLPPYVELDCSNARVLNRLIKKLGLDSSDAKYGSYSNSFEELYGIDRKIMNNSIPELTFKTVRNIVGPLVKRNMQMFNKYTK